MWALCAMAVLAGCSFEPRAAPASDAPAIVDAAVDSPVVPIICPARYTEKYEGHSYVMTGLGSRDSARMDCEADGGHLIKIESDAEALELASRVDIFPSLVWIGLFDRGTGYVWHDDSAPIEFARWGNGVPPPAEPDCIVENTIDNDGRWYANNCTENLVGVCECDGD
jgi:hypothetical protein